MRHILHIDMNSYFATVEQQANPKLRGRPIAVLGSRAKRTIIVAASVEAKKFGVKTGTRVEEAHFLCPNLILVYGEPRKYSHVTKKFIHIFEDYTDKVEIFSIDEAFLDVTDALSLFGSPEKIAREIKRRIRKEIGAWISCSIGIGPNKFLAKTGSDLKKPDGLVIITPENKDEILLNLPLKEYCGIGQRILVRLHMLGIDTTEELRKHPQTSLNKEFGIATGQKLKRMAYGLDSSPVKPWREQAPAKSFSCGRTMNRNVTKPEEIKKQILFLLEKVTKKMRDDGYWGREAGLWLRFKDFGGVGKSMKIGKWSCDSLEIYPVCLKILESFIIREPVRQIGVYIGQVQLAKNIPKSWLEEDLVNDKILSAMDATNNRFGEDVVVRASLAGTKLKEVVSGMGRKKFDSSY
jgi:DNA polymerase-4